MLAESSEVKTNRQGLTGISVRGYKSFYEESSIEIRPLTILAGANSSGKSSIMQPLLLMKQTLEATYDPGALLINGANVKFTSASQFLSYFSPDKQANQIKIKLEDNLLALTNIYTLHPPKGFDISEVIIADKEDGSRARYYPKMHEKGEFIDFFININQFKEAQKNFIVTLKDNDLPINKNLRGKIVRDRCFLTLEIFSKIGTVNNVPVVVYPIYNTINQTYYFEKVYIHQLLHVPGLRDNPRRSYETTAIGENYPGTFEKYTASVIADWQETNDERLEKVARYLNHLGLTDRIEATRINDVQIELRVGQSSKLQSNHLLNITDVGLGVSQVLPVIVAVLVASAGQLVYIEQPELHLHPRTQVALSDILADAAKRGVKVIVETHSELLLTGIQSLVAEDKLDPQLVKLHWFTKGEDGMSKINSAELDETGAFGNWPEDFGDISLSIQNRYLSAAETKLQRQSHDD